jgi:hypothetical protein
VSALTVAQARGFLNQIAEHANEWAGLPMPLEGSEMVIAKGYPWAEAFKKDSITADQDDFKVVNSWFSDKRLAWIHVVEEKGKRSVCIEGKVNHAGTLMETMGCSSVWDFEAEGRAVDKLESLIKPHLLKMYLLTGMFLETSQRSHVTYVFRRLRPTLALRPGKDDSMRILCGLCLHPIGYYRGTWAGAMVPTDDVVAHLMLMRADELYLWRKANHIPAIWPEAGIG